MDIARSTSGAYIVRLVDIVIKLGDGAVGDRIGEQAQWLLKYECPYLMPVNATLGAHAYVMPHADTWGTRIAAKDVFETTSHILYEGVWSRDAESTCDPLTAVMAKVCTMPHINAAHRAHIIKMSTLIDWDALPKCLTHGDPTFCNVMWLDGKPILSDPIPSGVLPDVRALDLGKLVQSCLGFESIVHGWRYLDGTPNPYWVRDLCRDENEWMATIVFALLHIARLIPYVDASHEQEFGRVFDEILHLRP